MTRRPIRICRRSPGLATHAYRIGGFDVVSSGPLTGADAFDSTPDLLQESVPAAPPEPPGPLVYDGEGWLDGRLVRARCRVWGTGYEIAIDGRYRYWVAGDGGAILQVVAAPEEDDSTWVLGPPLILAMALRGVYCLHASAIAREGDGEIVALSGPSGTGKSTLAAAAHSVRGLRRCADDVVPLAGDDPGIALPRFPQLKLGSDQPSRTLPERLPLFGLIWLGEPATTGSPRLRALNGAAAVTRVIAATVAARIFPPETSARHLAFCAALVRSIPIAELIYPRRMELLPAAVAAVMDWAGSSRSPSPPAPG